MNKDNLPLKIDPFRFADNNLSLSGFLQVKELSRLCSSLHSMEGKIKVDLFFGRDEQELRYIKGNIETSLQLQCQRCLEPYHYAIIGNFLCGIVQTEEEAATLPERYDPLIVESGEVFLNDIIEEELIVSLPIVPMHDVKQCKINLPFESQPDEVENPFNVLKSLHSKRDQ